MLPVNDEKPLEITRVEAPGLDEAVEMLGGSGLTLDEANAMIMDARAHWFEDDHKPITDEVQEIQE